MSEYGKSGNPGVTIRGKRSFLQGPWHFCARCGDKTHIADMAWQHGLLLCLRQCYDTGIYPLIGQREAAIAQKLSNLTFSTELMPDPKLTDPDIEGSVIDDSIIY